MSLSRLWRVFAVSMPYPCIIGANTCMYQSICTNTADIFNRGPDPGIKCHQGIISWALLMDLHRGQPNRPSFDLSATRSATFHQSVRRNNLIWQTSKSKEDEPAYDGEKEPEGVVTYENDNDNDDRLPRDGPFKIDVLQGSFVIIRADENQKQDQ
eukprot:TRINITY_DN1896_c1_g1_i2.p1 TRINITY_DN1896_c1_g1~~TRINITY_DN1896_c1_g1_i2.p1  ORF type:complete len:155 (+),score=12.02 TRINITY_DN1896_c1_g1_i2:977-1441(+)